MEEDHFIGLTDQSQHVNTLHTNENLIEIADDKLMDEPLLFQDNELENSLIHHPPFQRPSSPVRYQQDSYCQEVPDEEENYIFEQQNHSMGQENALFKNPTARSNLTTIKESQGESNLSASDILRNQFESPTLPPDQRIQQRYSLDQKSRNMQLVDMENDEMIKSMQQ